MNLKTREFPSKVQVFSRSTPTCWAVLGDLLRRLQLWLSIYAVDGRLRLAVHRGNLVAAGGRRHLAGLELGENYSVLLLLL